MSLEINQTFAKIGIDRIPENLAIETRAAKLELHQNQAKINIHSDLPKVQIDQYECFAAAGLRNNMDIIRNAAQKGLQQVMSFIAKTASDGQRLSAIQYGGNAIAAIAKRDSMPGPQGGLDYPSSLGPRISMRGGGIQIDPVDSRSPITNGVEGYFTPSEISINFTPSEIRVKMLQYGSINFSYQPGNIDSYI